MKTRMIAVLATVLCTAALAHGGVKNAAVKARMDLMVQIRDATGVLVSMAKGEAPFKPKQAEQARATLEEASGKIVAHFREPAMDAKSESLPAIWTNWEDFAARSRQLRRVTAEVDTSTLPSLRAGVGQVGRACAACHEHYRIKK
ncbi:MAG: cytochrome c [Roseivivax sp.]|nr:cytochrome c [Roseivivax sp.]